MASAQDNPFRSERIDCIPYRLADSSWELLYNRFRWLNYRAAIVGRHGRGKTTLLDSFTPRLIALGHRLRRFKVNQSKIESLDEPDARAIMRAGNDTIVVVDGAEQLSFAAWQIMKLRTSHAGGLLITTHEPGRLPTLYECRSSIGMTMDLVATLAPRTHAPDQVHALFHKHDGNVREVFREFYDRS